MKIIMSIFFSLFLFNKTPTEIAESLKPKNSKIVHQVIQTNIWNIKNVIIAFYETRYVDPEDKYKHENQYVEAYLLIPDANEKYRKVLIDKFQDDNVDTNIESVFFANADKDAEKELIILSTVEHRLQYLYEGIEYSVSIYDNFSERNIPQEMKTLNLPIVGGFDGYTEADGKSKAKYRNAEDVKKKLKKLGYK